MLRTLRAREIACRWGRVVLALLEYSTRELSWNIADRLSFIYASQERFALEGDEVWSD